MDNRTITRVNIIVTPCIGEGVKIDEINIVVVPKANRIDRIKLIRFIV